MDELTVADFERAAKDKAFRSFLMTQYRLTEADLPPLEGASDTFADVQSGGSTTAKSQFGQTWQRGAAPSGTAEGVGRSFVRGLIPFADEVGAAGQAVGERIAGRTPDISDRYSELMAESDSARHAFTKSDPVKSTAAEIAGAFTPIGALSRGKAVLAGVPQVPGRLAQMSSAAKRVIGTGVVGGAAGALAGADNPAEGESRSEGAMRGTAWGAATGGALGTAAEVAAPVKRLIGRIGGTSSAPEVAARYAEQAGQTGKDFLARMQQQAGQGKAPVVADVLGQTGLRMGRDVAGKSPEGADILSAFGRARTAPSVAQSEAVRDVAVATGITLNPTILTERLIAKARRDLAGKVYPVLRQATAPIDDPQVLRALDTDLGRKAYQAARRMAQADMQAAGVAGRPPVPFVPIFDTKGNLRRAPNLATLDWIKRGMDELLKPGTITKPSQGATLSDTELGALREIRTVLMRRLDELGEAGNAALKAYGEVRGEQETAFFVADAMEQGFKRFKAATIADGAITDDLTQLATEASARQIDGGLIRRAYQQAAIDAFASRLRSGTFQKAEQLTAIRSLRALGIQPQQIDDLLGRLGTTQERQRIGTVLRDLLGGADDHVGGNYAAGVSDLATGNAPGAGRNIFKAWRPAMSAGLTRSNAPRIARALTDPNPAPFVADMTKAQRAMDVSRHRFDREALMAYLLGQQAGDE